MWLICGYFYILLGYFWLQIWQFNLASLMKTPAKDKTYERTYEKKFARNVLEEKQVIRARLCRKTTSKHAVGICIDLSLFVGFFRFPFAPGNMSVGC